MHRSLAAVFGLGLISGQALAQEREWTLDASDQEAYLIFGVAESDDVGVSLWCNTGKDMVNLYIPRPSAELQKLSRRKVPVTVTAGGETATFGGKIDINPDSPSSSVEVELAVDGPILKALEKADRFSVKVHGEELVFPLYDADVAGLVALCRKG
ncbi:hypothetical protein [Aestuariivirga sp.]|uniref:hypothetical protein n=1 Tax=Aestuariivirga sp. TaxID=2650926 RepID=UPI0025B9A82B|nr:hypothetical protein [Aestuariivirga sp.]MCA3555578.1 hypothetical protein [Aestuariivirga sp.]